MKKTLLALILCLAALCICCAATADDGITWTITPDANDQGNTAVLDNNRNVNMSTWDHLNISVCVPGATDIEVWVCDSRGNEMYPVHTGEGQETFNSETSTLTVNGWTTDAEGNLQLKAKARMIVSGEGEEPEYQTWETVYPGLIYVHSWGNLPAPQVTVDFGNETQPVIRANPDGTYTIGFSFAENPEVIEDAEGVFDDVWYNAYLWNDAGETVCDNQLGVSAGTLSFSNVQLETGHAYRVSVDIQQREWNGIATDVWFMVLPEDQNIQWSFTGVSEELTTHDEIGFSVFIPGATRTGVVIRNTAGEEIYYGEKEGNIYTENGWSTDSGDDLTFTALAWFGNDMRAEFAYPNQIAVHSAGLLPAPTVEIDIDHWVAGSNGSGFYAVDWGQQIHFSFAENADLIVYDGEEIAQYADVWYNAYLFDRNGDIIDSIHDIMPGEDYWFETGNDEIRLAGDEEYRISVDIQQHGYTGTADYATFRVNPNLRLMVDNENDESVVVNNNGSVSVPMHQWINFVVSAPGNGGVAIYWLDSVPVLGDDESIADTLPPERDYEYFTDCWPGDGWDYFTWTPNDLPADWAEREDHTSFTKYIVAEARYWMQNGTLIYKRITVPVHAAVDETIDNPIAYVLDGNYNYTNDENHYPIVARNGRLFIKVTNDPDVDYYGAYIPKAGVNKSDDYWDWIADSHWIPRSDDGSGYTLVPLTVSRCTPGNEYKVHVYAIKFGAPQVEAETTTTIYVGPVVLKEEENESPVIISMGDEFDTGEPLRVFAYYTNPRNIDGWMNIVIHRVGDPDDIIYEGGGEFYDYWNDTEVSWREGQYTVDAYIWTWSSEENQNVICEEYHDLKTIRVNAVGNVAEIEANYDLTVSGGSDMTFTISAIPGPDDGDDVAAADHFSFNCERIDEGWNWVDGSDHIEATNGQATITINKDRLSDVNKDGSKYYNGYYVVRVSGHKAQYNESYTEFRFVVTSANEETPSLTLTVNNSDAAEQTALSSDGIQVKVTYGSEENRPTAVRILNGDHWEHWFGDNESFERNWSFGDGDLMLYAEASLDPVDFDALDRNGWGNFDINRDMTWTGISNVIRLHVESPNGEMAAPVFTLANEEMGENGSGIIPFGDDLIVNIADLTPMAVDTEAQGGKTPVEDGWFFCNMYVERSWEGYTWWDQVDDLTFEPLHTGENLIPTYQLEAGCNYRIEIGADAVGYSGRSNTIEFALGRRPEETIRYFTVNRETGSETGTVTVQAGVDLQLIAYYSGAEWYSVEITNADDNTTPEDERWRDYRDQCSNGMLYDSWRASNGGTYILTAYAYGLFRDGNGNEITVNGENQWKTPIGTVYVIATTVENPDMGEIDAAMNDLAYAGADPLTITFEELENAPGEGTVFYSYWIHSDDSNEWLDGDVRTGAGTMTIDMGRLRGPGVYWAELDAWSAGYNQSHATLHFALLDPNDTELSGNNYFFTCSAEPAEEGGTAATDFIAETSEDIRYIYYVRGAQEVNLMWRRTDWTEGQMNDFGWKNGPGISQWHSFGNRGTYEIYGSWIPAGQDQWTEPVRLCSIEVSAEGSLGEPWVDMPMAVRAGEDVTIAFHRDEIIDSYGFWMSYEGNNAWEFGRNIHRNEMNDSPEGNNNDGVRYDDDTIWFTIPKEELEPNRAYHIYLDITSQGYEQGHGDRTLYVLGEPAEGITISGPESITFSENFAINVSAQGAEKIIVWWETADLFQEAEGENAQMWYCQDWNPMTEDPVSGEEEAVESCHFYAFALFGDGRILVSRTIIIPFNRTEVGTADAPTLTIGNEGTIYQGQFIEAVVGGIEDEGVTEYKVFLTEADDDNWIYAASGSEAGTILIPTYDLLTGHTYYMYAYARVPGKFRTDSEPVYVMIYPAESNGFYCSTNTVQVMEHMTVSVVAPGAERIRFSSGYGWWDESGWEGDRWHADLSWDYAADTVTIQADALFPGDEEWTTIGSQEITITKKDDLAAAVLTNIPQTVTVDLPVSISFPAVENAERYEVYVKRLDNGDGRNFNCIAGANNTVSVTIPGDMLNEENIGYLIRVIAFGTGYNASEAETNFVTIAAETSTSTRIIVLSADRDIVESNNGNVRFTVTAAGATLVRLYHEGDWFWAPTNENSIAVFDVGFNESILQPVWATACYDPQYGTMTQDELNRIAIWQLPFEGISNVLHIQVTSRGETEGPEWVDVPESVSWGQWLPVTISEGGNAERYHIRIRTATNEQMYFREVNYPGTFLLPTTELETGKYHVSLDCGRTGYTWHHAGDYDFTVLPLSGETPEPYMTADAETLLTYEPYHVMMYAPGAIALKAVNHDDDNDLNGYWENVEHIASDDFWWEEAGTFTLDGYAQYPADDTHTEPYWQKIGYVTLQVISRDLAAPEIQADPVVSNTDALDILIPLVANGGSYQVNIHHVNSLNTVYEKVLTAESATDGVLTFTVPAGKLEDGKSYWIDCYVEGYRPGFNRSDYSRTILVNNSGAAAGITITTDRTEVPVNDPFRVTVDAQGATAIIIRCGDWSQGYPGEHVDEWFSEYQAFPEILYAQACYDENPVLPDNPWDSGWENLNWSSPSAVVNMVFTAEGPAGQADFTAPETIQRGDILKVTDIYPGDGANEAHANILRSNLGDGDEDWVFGDRWYGWDESRRSIFLPTSMLEPGTYQLAVDSSGIGHTGNRRWHQFTVTEREQLPENGIVFIVPAKVQTGITAPMSIYAPGAVRIGYAINLNGEEKQNPDNYLKQDGDTIFDMENLRWGEAGTQTITAYAEFENETGETVSVTADRTVNVCNPLTFDLSGLPGYLESGKTNASVTILLPENAEWMNIQIYDDNGDIREKIIQKDNLDDNETFAIPVQYLTEGHLIQIDYQAFAEWFSDSCGGTYIMVAAPAGNNAILTLAEGQINSIQTNEQVKFLVSATEGHTLTAVRFYDGYGYWENGNEINHNNHDDWFEEDGSAYFWCNYNHNDDPDRIMHVFAQVRVDGGSEWKTTNWLQFTVTSPNGYTGAYDFESLTPITARQGEPVTVTFTESANANQYWADVFAQEGWSYCPQTISNGTTVTISTINIPAGEYTIAGRAGTSEPGWRWSESDSRRKLIITSDRLPMEDPTFITPANLTEIEDEAFAGTAATSVQISGSVQWVHDRAFADSRVAQVIVMNGNTWISDRAFEGCGSIVVFSEPNSEVQGWADRNCYEFYPIPNN